MRDTWSSKRTVRLIATVGLGFSVMMTAGCPLLLPALTAEAGPDQTVGIGGAVVLEGAASGGSAPYTYQWSPATGLSSATAAQPTLTATAVGVHTYTLTVTDSAGATATDTVTVTVTTTNPPVVANAGPDLTGAVGLPVTLQGSATGGNNVYGYSWAPTTGLSNPAVAQPTFTPTAGGTVTFTLTVTDGEGATATDTVDVVVSTATVLQSLTWAADYSSGGYAVVAVFNQALDRNSGGTLTNYQVSGTTTNPSSATVGADDKTVTLVFTTPLAITSTFDLSVGGGLLDASGNGVAAITNQAAATNTADTTVPTASSIQWGANYSGSYQVLIVFSEAVDRTSAETRSAYRVNGTTLIAESATVGSDGKTVTIVFDGIPLSTNSGLDLSVGNTVKDINGNGAVHVLNQAVAANPADTTAPTIAAIRHAANFTGGGYQVDVEFSEAMSRAAVENTAGYRISGTTTTPGSAVLGTDGRTVSLNFQIPLSTTNQLDVSVGNTVKDINGQTLSAQTNQAIVAGPDTTAPTVSSATWAANLTSAGYQIQVVFGESMDQTSVETEANWRINGTTTAPSSATLGTDGKTVTLTFAIALASTRTLDISVGNAINDINGNALTLLSGQSILANGADTTAPTVSTRVWGNGQTTYQAIVTFNESMDATSATTLSNYTLAGNGGADSRNPTAAGLATNGKTVTLSFGTTTAGFKIGDTLTVTANVKDINGQATTSTAAVAVAANGSDTTVPTVSTRQWGANFAGPGYQVQVIFNEVMNKTTAETVANYRIGGADTVAATAALGADGRTVTLTFTGIAGGLSSADVLDVSVGNSVNDINAQTAAESLNQAVAANAGDTTSPTIVSTTEPVGGQVNVEFSEVLDNSTIAVGDFTDIKDGAGLKDAVADGVTLQVDGKTVVVTHTGDIDTGDNASIDVATIDDVNGQTITAVDDQVVPTP